MPIDPKDLSNLSRKAKSSVIKLRVITSPHAPDKLPVLTRADAKNLLDYVTSLENYISQLTDETNKHHAELSDIASDMRRFVAGIGFSSS